MVPAFAGAVTTEHPQSLHNDHGLDRGCRRRHTFCLWTASSGEAGGAAHRSECRVLATLMGRGNVLGSNCKYLKNLGRFHSSFRKLPSFPRRPPESLLHRRHTEVPGDVPLLLVFR